jgi:tetratricopeptide (TPR) repeat protein
LLLYPDSADGQRLLLVAQTGIDQIGLAEKEAATNPSVDHYLSLSVYYYENQRYEDCVRAAREALKIDPNLGEAYANIATAYHTLGKVDEAIAALREEVRINPGLRSAQKNLNYELAKKAAAGH